jgi:hypothetical protein
MMVPTKLTKLVGGQTGKRNQAENTRRDLSS